MYNTVPALRWNEIFFQSFILFAIFFSLSYRRGLLVDKRSEPRPSERVPYVIVYGSPGQSLIQLVRTPGDLSCQPWTEAEWCLLCYQTNTTCIGQGLLSPGSECETVVSFYVVIFN